MKVVIDTNVLMAGLLKDSVVRLVLLSPNIKFFLPEFAINEIKKHESTLLQKSSYNKKELTLLMNYLLKNVRIIPEEKLKRHLKEAESIMQNIDINDSPFIAAALATNSDGIWSYDSHFKQQSKIKVLSIKELIENSSK